MKQENTSTEINEAGQAAAFKLIPISALHESPLNPRRHFDEKALAELAESIRTHGILTPLLVRPNAEGFEIAAGHRRFRAAQRAGVEEAPVIVREMTDQQFLEVVTIENLQREDIHPVEEADGYQKLIDQYGYTAETLAERVGRSESYIAKRLALSRLIEVAKLAFLEGRIQLGHAQLLMRLKPEDQAEAHKEALFERGGRWVNGKWVKSTPEAVKVSALDEWIRENIYLDLSSAAWRKDDRMLLAGAGPCTTCPKRTGANGLLFDDLQKGDMCLDADCFHQKRDNHLIAVQKAAKEAGTPLIRIAREYVSDAAKQGLLESGAYRLVGGKKDRCEHVEKAVIAVGSREVGKVVDICRTKDCKKHGDYLYGRSVVGQQEQKTFAQIWADRKIRLEERIAIEAKRELWRQIVHDVPEEFNRPEMDLVAKWLIERAGHDGRRELCAALGLEGEKNKGYNGTDFSAPLEGYLERLADKDVPGFLVGLSLHGFSYRDREMTAIAKLYEIDPAVVKKTVTGPLLADFEKRKAKAAVSDKKRKQEAKRAEKSSTAEASKTAGKKGKRTKAAAAAENSSTIDRKSAAAGEREEDSRVWPKPNEHGVYDPKDCIVVKCPDKGIDAKILLLETEEGWIGSFEFQTNDAGHGALPREFDVVLPSQTEALACQCETLLASVDEYRKTSGTQAGRAQLGKIRKWAEQLRFDHRIGDSDAQD